MDTQEIHICDFLKRIYPLDEGYFEQNIENQTHENHHMKAYIEKKFHMAYYPSASWKESY